MTLNELEWLYHVDIDPAVHDKNHTLLECIGVAGRIVEDRMKFDSIDAANVLIFVAVAKRPNVEGA